MKVNIVQWLCEKTKLDKKIVVVFIVGIIGVVLLVATELMPADEDVTEPEIQPETEQTGYSQYAEDIENRLEELISSIEGAGKTQVMVTLECSDENVYATEQKRSDGETGSTYEDSVVIVENEGGENGVLLKITQPEIRGVAVVCTGANSPVVKQSIIDTVTAVLDISSARVNIATMKKDNGG